MIWRTDKPTEKVIVAKLTEDFCHQKDSYAILRFANEPYQHYSEDGEEIPYTAIEKWASLEEDKLPEGLEEAANNYGIDVRLGYPRVMDETDRYIYNAFIAGAEYQRKQDQSLIELAEDHAMLAGMNKMKEEMMEKAVEADVNTYEYLAAGKSWAEFVVEMPTKNLGDKVKVIVIKEEK